LSDRIDDDRDDLARGAPAGARASGAPPATEAELLRDIYDRELAYVWSTLRRLGIPSRNLEDLSHDVFLVVHRRFAEYDRARPIRPWLFGIAYRVAAQYHRRANVRNELLDAAVEPAGNGSTPLDDLLQKQNRRLVADALASLDLERRALFIMYEIDGVPVTEIAEQLQLPLNTAYTRLRLARRDFRDAIARAQGKGSEP
jgi:RNA polymerase sigma-70 factor (ECF subfamily)